MNAVQRALLFLPFLGDAIITFPQSTKIDVRTFLAEQSCNQKDHNGYTFFYRLAMECAQYNEWNPIRHQINAYMQNNTGYIPNPFIEHKIAIGSENHSLTAKQKAQEQFKKTGNPVCKVLQEFLSETEIMFVDCSSSEQGRKQMAHPTK